RPERNLKKTHAIFLAQSRRRICRGVAGSAEQSRPRARHFRRLGRDLRSRQKLAPHRPRPRRRAVEVTNCCNTHSIVEHSKFARPAAMKSAKKTERRSESISLRDEDQVKSVVAEAVLGLWDVVNNLTRLKPSSHDRYRVTIFGSARIQPGSFGYEETKRCAAELAKLGCDIITGGGPGLMQAANEGAASTPERAKSI